MSNFFTNIKDKLFPKPDLDFDDDFSDDVEDIGDIEVDAKDPQSVSEAKKKNIIIAAVALALSVIVYFVIFSEEEVKEELVKSSDFAGSVSKSSESPFEIKVEETKPEDEVTILDAPEVPELPAFPEVEDEKLDDGLKLEDSIFEEDNKEEEDDVINDSEEKLLVEIQGKDGGVSKKGADKEKNPQDIDDADPDQAAKKKVISDPRYAPIIVVKGGPSNDISGVGSDNNLKILNESEVVKVDDSAQEIKPTQIKNRENVVAQGKIINAVLETAIDTELEGTARAIVSRDVYGEVGNHVLIPKGSRLFGSYSTNNNKGEARVQVSWNRLIRPDGISLAISSGASDQFGRAGIEGNIDNKVQETIANSLLSSALAIAGIAATDALTGGSNSTTTTNPSTGSSTVTQTAINQAVSDVASNITKSATSAVSGLFDVRPRITIPQGTRVNIIVNSDIKVPTFER